MSNMSERSPKLTILCYEKFKYFLSFNKYLRHIQKKKIHGIVSGAYFGIRSVEFEQKFYQLIFKKVTKHHTFFTLQVIESKNIAKCSGYKKL